MNISGLPRNETRWLAAGKTPGFRERTFVGSQLPTEGPLISASTVSHCGADSVTAVPFLRFIELETLTNVPLWGGAQADGTGLCEHQTAVERDV